MKVDLTLKATENGVDKVLILWSGEAENFMIPAIFNGLDGMASNLGMIPAITKLELDL